MGAHDGYHLAVATGTAGGRWRQVAILDPDGIEDSSWTGYQCASGDGRYAAVVILPASAVNTPSLREHGAFAYSVDLATGAVRPVATGVAATYSDPGCGTGDDAVFTAALGQNEQTTQVIRASLATGRVERQASVPGQFTSGVPMAGNGAVNAAAMPSSPGIEPFRVVPDFVPAGVTSPIVQVRAETGGAGESAGSVRTNSPQAPACVVPRLDPHAQVLQPNAARVNWASQMSTPAGSTCTRQGCGSSVMAACGVRCRMRCTASVVSRSRRTVSRCGADSW